jgi:SHS2 domain-containing protein
VAFLHVHEKARGRSSSVSHSRSTGAEHRFEEHTGEVRLKVSALTCEELFAEAGRALAELMLGETFESHHLGPERSVEVRGRDRAALFVEWLNELIFLSETTKQVFTHFRVQQVDETHARAVVGGVTPEMLKTAVKAATLHGVSVEFDGERWRAAVVLDV